MDYFLSRLRPSVATKSVQPHCHSRVDQARREAPPCTIRIPASIVKRMAEAGSFADRVKQQADIVRVVGEYVRLKKSGQNFTRPVPVSFRKDAVVCGASGEADLSLLWVRRGRRRFQIRDGDGQDYVSGGGARRRGKMRHRHSARAGAHARGAPGKSAAHFARGIASRSGGVFRAAVERNAGRPRGQGVSARPRAGLRRHGALRHRLRAVGRRRAAARVEAEISGESARSFRPVQPRPERPALSTASAAA